MILKLVPRDHVDQLPVPKQIKDYLKTPNYYSETYIEEAEENEDNAEVTAEIVTNSNMPNNDELSSVEATENLQTNEMYLDTNIQHGDDQAVPSSNVQVNHVAAEAVGLNEEADGGQEDQQQERVTPM